MRMAKAEKDVFSVYESLKATPFGVAFYLSKSQVQKIIHRAELKMHLSLLFVDSKFGTIEKSLYLCIVIKKEILPEGYAKLIHKP